MNSTSSSSSVYNPGTSAGSHKYRGRVDGDYVSAFCFDEGFSVRRTSTDMIDNSDHHPRRHGQAVIELS